MHVKRLFGSLLVVVMFLLPLSGQNAFSREPDIRLVMPEKFIDIGLATYLLPRFRFKTRIRVEAVPDGSLGDASLLSSVEGAAIMSADDGTAFHLHTTTEDPIRVEKVKKLLDWLQSEPGRAAIESFQLDGKQVFAPGAAKVLKKVEIKVDGDVDQGAQLALLHCGRCHVVDSRNPFGGIGSTPSFGAMKNLPNWLDRFSTFWTVNPHPSFTQIVGVTEPFDPALPPPIAPLILTPDEVEAITAFVVSMPTKDLGGAVEAR